MSLIQSAGNYGTECPRRSTYGKPTARAIKQFRKDIDALKAGGISKDLPNDPEEKSGFL